MRAVVAKRLRGLAIQYATDHNEYIAPQTIRNAKRYVMTDKYGAVVLTDLGAMTPFPYNGTIRIREGSARRTYKKLKRLHREVGPKAINAFFILRG